MDVADLDYDLPHHRIAQQPVEPRDAARLLVDRGPGAEPDHRRIRDLPSLVRPGDVMVVNDTRVLRARLRLRKATGGAVEVLLLEATADGWEALVRPSRKVPPGTELFVAGGTADAGDVALVRVDDDLGDGRRRVHLLAGGDDLDVVERHGEVPLPPYVRERLADPERYQTVYASRPASVAAPTAGLHLTPAVLDRCRDAGAELHRVELVVGMGTFRPISAERVEDHDMHEERYHVPPATLEACRAARRVLAVGTTSVRALESAAATGRLEGRTDLFVHGEYPWRVVDLLLTNFHLPRSSLLAMIESFVGPRWRQLYGTALAGDYRFLSFGDAMLLARTRGGARPVPEVPAWS
jgi:S-adenosylmethionine:tRNA ribosyltransferase-isomerase